MSGGYELHQKLRTKAVRQLKRKDYDGAITSLYDGAKQLLQTKEQGSGCDLACYMVDVYSQAATPSTEDSRKKIIELVGLAAPDFWRKKVIDAAIKWSTAVTKTPAGDGYLRLGFGDILSQTGDYHAAEIHYIVACSPPPGLPNASELYPAHAPKSFACMMLDWLAAHGKETVEKNGGKGQAETVERIMAGSFALRGLFPLLLARSLTSSRGFMSIFASRLASKHPKILLPVQPNPKPYTPPGGSSSAGSEPVQLYLTASSELNFAQMALALTTQAADHKRRTKGQRVPDSLRETWIGLVRQFEKESGDEDDFIFEALPSLSEIYFDMQPPRGQGGNFMQEMLGNLMGGGASSDNKSATPAPVRHAPPPRIPKIDGEIEDDSSASAGASAPGAADELDLD